MRQSFLKFGVLALVAMGFVACSEESRLGIKKPLVFPTMDNYGKIYYAIQSQDENTAIENYIVNRGNCGEGLAQYEYDLDLYKQHKEELCAKYKDKEICSKLYGYGGGYSLDYLLDKQGKKIDKKYSIYSNKEDVDYFNNLHDDFKKLYSKVEPKKLGYGETMKINIGKCDSGNIMEVQLVLNGGKKVTYNLKGGY